MSDFLTASGLILTVLLAVMLIQRNQAATIRAQEAHLRNQLKVELYQRAAKVFHDAAQRLTTLTGMIRSVSLSVKFIAQGHPFSYDKTSEDLIAGSSHAAEGINNVLATLEQNEIVFSRFAPFRRELSTSYRKMLDSFNELWTMLAKYVPLVDRSSGQVVGTLSKPTEQDLADLESLIEVHWSVCGDALGYLVDLQIEAQNELLGDLFGRQLPPRAPGDPAVRVLRRDPVHLTSRPPGGLV